MTKGVGKEVGEEANCNFNGRLHGAADFWQKHEGGEGVTLADIWGGEEKHF